MKKFNMSQLSHIERVSPKTTCIMLWKRIRRKAIKRKLPLGPRNHHQQHRRWLRSIRFKHAMIREKLFPRNARKPKLCLKSSKIIAMCFTKANDCMRNPVLSQSLAVFQQHRRLRARRPPPRRHLSMNLKSFIVHTAPMLSSRKKQWRMAAMNSSTITITTILIRQLMTFIFPARHSHRLSYRRRPTIPPHQQQRRGWRRSQNWKVFRRKKLHLLSMTSHPPILISSNLSFRDQVNMQLSSTFIHRSIFPRQPSTLLAR